jgi:hypothetical protein
MFEGKNFPTFFKKIWGIRSVVTHGPDLKVNGTADRKKVKKSIFFSILHTLMSEKRPNYGVFLQNDAQN